jgi:hypothetical protein
MSALDPKIAALANALADAVADGLATRAQVLSAMQLAYQGGEIAGALEACGKWGDSIDKITKVPA